MTSKRRNTMLLVVGAAGLLAVIAGASQLPFMGNTPAPSDPGPALALPKAEHVVVSSVDAPIVDVTAAGVLINGKHVAARPGRDQASPIQPVIAALRALRGSTKASASGFRRAVLRADASTDATILEPVLASLHLGGYVDVVAGVHASGPCLSAAGSPLGSACQLAVEPLSEPRDEFLLPWGLVIEGAGYEFVESGGARIEVPNRDQTRDLAALRDAMRKLRQGARRGLDVAAGPGTRYADLVAAIDLALDEGFTDVFLSTGTCFPRGLCFRQLEEQR